MGCNRNIIQSSVCGAQSTYFVPSVGWGQFYSGGVRGGTSTVCYHTIVVGWDVWRGYQQGDKQIQWGCKRWGRIITSVLKHSYWQACLQCTYKKVQCRPTGQLNVLPVCQSCPVFSQSAILAQSEPWQVLQQRHLAAEAKTGGMIPCLLRLGWSIWSQSEKP